MVFTTNFNELVTVDKNGQIYEKIDEKWFGSGGIQALELIEIQQRSYALVACQMFSEGGSTIKLYSIPELILSPHPFAETPRLISCLKVSDDHNYLAAGCHDGYVIVYHVRWDDQQHEMFDVYHPHSFKITDMVLIKGGHDSKDYFRDIDGHDDDGRIQVDSIGYLIASISYDRTLAIYSLKQRVTLIQIDIRFYLEQIAYHQPSNKIYVRTYDYQMYEIDMNVKLFQD